MEAITYESNMTVSQYMFDLERCPNCVYTVQV